MADWGQPTLPDTYPDFQDRLKGRDIDAATMCLVDPTNPPVGIFRYNRTINAFQEWNGSAWVTRVIAAAGGGTGSGSGLPALGTMASQNANNVAITGGDIRGLNFLASNGELHVGSNVRMAGILVSGSSQIQLTDASGKIPILHPNYITDMNGQYINNLNGSQITHGTVYRDRLGSGATGGGSKVLVDNGTWVDKNLVGGGMVEIVHNDSSFGSGEVSKDVPILWAGPIPTSTKKISIQLNSALSNINWKVLTVDSFRIRLNAEAPGTIVDWTAFHHITQV